MASFYGGCGEASLRPAGWRQRNASRPIKWDYATSASQQKSGLLDHFVDGRKKRVRRRTPFCLGLC